MLPRATGLSVGLLASFRAGLIALCFLLLLPAAPLFAQSAPKEMLLYTGITMARPIAEIARAFEQRENVKITIVQGGSADVYQSAKKSGVGDWFLPGMPAYRDRFYADGLFGEHVVVGYNQIALIVQEGNPKQVKPDLRELLRKDLVMIIGNAESCSGGLMAKILLTPLGIYPQVVRSAAFLAPDSRALMLAMRKKEADVTLNWRAVGFFPDNAPHIDIIDLPGDIAQPQPLLLTRLKSSRHPEIARRFMDFAASEAGQAIFRKHGFLDSKMSVGR